MTGLEKIISKIDTDSAERCSAVISDAEKSAAETVTKAISDGESEAAVIVEAAEKQAEHIARLAAARIEGAHKQAILSAKISAITAVISDAKDKLSHLPADEYFSALLTLLEKNIQPGKCVFMLSPSDFARIPEGFYEKTVKLAAEKNSELSFADAPADIADGFVLKYGDIEINCTLDALISERLDKLRETVNAILFGV